MTREGAVVAALRQAAADPSVNAVTIDFWDTLVERIEPANDVRSAVCAWAVAEWSLPLNAADVHALFDDVAAALSSAATQIGLDYEYRASTAWSAVLREILGGGTLQAERVQAIALAEVRLSVQRTRVAPAVVSEMLKMPRLPIVVVSDNEMSAGQLSAIASAHGLALPRILVSSEHGRTKRSGALLKAALVEASEPAQRVMHIGDDERGDRVMPARLGMRVPDVPVPPAEHMGTQSLGASGSAARHGSDRVAPDRLGGSVAHFVRFVQAEIRRVEPDRVVFLGSEGSYFSQFFTSREDGDGATYQVASLGRRHFLGGAVARDPSWVVQRCLVSGIPVSSIGAVLVDPNGEQPRQAEAEVVGPRAVESFWRSGQVRVAELPLAPSAYEDAAGERVRELGIVNDRERLLVVDVGYRATAAQAIALLAGNDVHSVAMFGEARYLVAGSERFTWWLSVKATQWGTSTTDPGEEAVPKVTPPLEVLLAAGPRAPLGDSTLASTRRAIASAASRHLVTTSSLGEAERLMDAETWTALIEAPPRAVARSVLRALHDDDLHSAFAPARSRRPRALQDRVNWKQGSDAMLTRLGGAMLDSCVSTARRLRGRFR